MKRRWGGREEREKFGGDVAHDLGGVAAVEDGEVVICLLPHRGEVHRYARLHPPIAHGERRDGETAHVAAELSRDRGGDTIVVRSRSCEGRPAKGRGSLCVSSASASSMYLDAR